MTPLVLAASLLIVAPLVGAGLLLLAGRAGRSGRPLTGPLTIATIVVTGVALVLTLEAAGVIGSAVDRTIGLGPLDPVGTPGRLVWTVAPVLLALLFAGIAHRTRSRPLLALALAQLVLATVVASGEGLPPGAGETHAAVRAALLLDPLAGLLLAVSALVGGLIALYALGYEPVHLAHRRLPPERTADFLAWLFVFLASMHLLVLADDLRVLTVGWELTTLCSFVLIGFDGDRPAVAGARRALAYNIGGGIALTGAALLAGPGATVSGLLAGEVGSAALLPLILTGLIVAAAVKSALIPFHPWLLGAMVAAAPVSALLHASTMVKAGSYLLLRLSPAIASQGLLGPALAGLGGVTFAGAALLALRERDLKRVLALSTVSSLGLIAASAGLGSPAALAAGMLLLAFHAVAKAAAFLCVGAIEQLSGTRDLESLVGAARHRPDVAALLIVSAAALTLPPFGIVVAKWALLILGAPDVALVVLLALGGAANLALWTGVMSRLLVRRVDPEAASLAGRLPASERSTMVILGAASLGGLALAAPVARAVADPASMVAFGRDAALAAGWSIALGSAGFAVPATGLLGVAAVVVGVLVARRIGQATPQPYLSGANMPASGPTAFHGGRGDPVAALSGGFYWASERGGPIDPTDVRRVVPTIGWLAIALVGVAALLAATGVWS